VEEVTREEIEELAAKKKVENAERSELKHKELQQQFAKFSERAWMKRYREETEAIAEEKRIEEAEETEEYERNRASDKRGLLSVEKVKYISSVTLTFTEEEARELLENIESAVGIKTFPYTILERIGVYLAEELDE